jgi:hypothetical protein
MAEKKKSAVKKTAPKYGKYLLSNSVVNPPPRDKTASSYVAAVSDMWKQVAGVKCNYAFSYITAPCLMPEAPHTHDNDEFLFFISTDPDNMQELGAVVEIAMGEEWEKNNFSTSTVIYIPRGLQHCPIHVKKVDRPFLFGHVWPGGEATNIQPPK